MLPLAVLILSVLSFVFTPINNTLVGTQEYEADIFGLNSARQPDGFAEAALLLGEYRKLDPSPLEEFLLFDHPSGRTRICSAMRWKAENHCLDDRNVSANRTRPRKRTPENVHVAFWLHMDYHQSPRLVQLWRSDDDQ